MSVMVMEGVADTVVVVVTVSVGEVVGVALGVVDGTNSYSTHSAMDTNPPPLLVSVMRRKKVNAVEGVERVK